MMSLYATRGSLFTMAYRHVNSIVFFALRRRRNRTEISTTLSIDQRPDVPLKSPRPRYRGRLRGLAPNSLRDSTIPVPVTAGQGDGHRSSPRATDVDPSTDIPASGAAKKPRHHCAQPNRSWTV